MLKYLINKKFTGDISLQDADILVQYSNQSKSILEFGAGASTQLFAQSGADYIVSVELVTYWSELTKKRLTQIQNATPVVFIDNFSNIRHDFDLIFVDGQDSLRKEFAITTWKLLKPNGIMIFHDTRRAQDFVQATEVAQFFHNEISNIEVNAKASDNVSSNMTILHKKEFEPYINWNYSEGKPSWAYGRPDDNEYKLWEYK
jgi:predicted O-methyltransferase YrrM